MSFWNTVYIIACFVIIILLTSMVCERLFPKICVNTTWWWRRNTKRTKAHHIAEGKNAIVVDAVEDPLEYRVLSLSHVIFIVCALRTGIYVYTRSKCIYSSYHYSILFLWPSSPSPSYVLMLKTRTSWYYIVIIRGAHTGQTNNNHHVKRCRVRHIQDGFTAILVINITPTSICMSYIKMMSSNVWLL